MVAPKKSIKPTADIYAAPATRPSARVTLVNPLREPASIANQLDADRAYNVIRAANAGDMTGLMCLYRDMIGGDSHIQTEATKRKLAVLNERPRFRPADPNSADDKVAADFCQEALRTCTNTLDGLAHLLDSAIWPVSIDEKVYVPTGSGFRLLELFPVPHRLIDYRDGTLRIFDTDDRGNVLSTSRPADPNRYIIHRGHLLSSPDTQGGPLRAIVIWWMLRSMDRTWWGRFLERYGSPFLVGKYDQADDNARVILENAFSWATRIGGLVISNETSVELQQAAASSTGEAYEKLLTVCNREISKLILGQASSEQQSTGLGSGLSRQQEQVRTDYRQWDSIRLGDTLRDQLFTQLLAANGLPGAAPYVSWGSESPEELKAVADVLGGLKGAGLEVDDAGIPPLSDRVGIPLRRTAAPKSARGPVLALSADPSPSLDDSDLQEEAFNSIAAKSAAPLAQAFRGRYAGIQQIILSSTSADDLERRVRAHLADHSPAAVADVLEKALVALAANGISGA